MAKLKVAGTMWIVMAVCFFVALGFWAASASVFREQEINCDGKTKDGKKACVISGTIWDTTNETVTSLMTVFYVMLGIGVIFLITAAIITGEEQRPARIAQFKRMAEEEYQRRMATAAAMEAAPLTANA